MKNRALRFAGVAFLYALFAAAVSECTCEALQ